MVIAPVSLIFFSVPVRSCAQTAVPTASATRANMIFRSTLMKSPVNNPSMITAPHPVSTGRASVTTGPPNVHGERPFAATLAGQHGLDRATTVDGFFGLGAGFDSLGRTAGRTLRG